VGEVTPLQDVDLARVKALIERYGPEAIIKVATDAKNALPPLAQRKFEQFKIEVDYLLPSLLGPSELLKKPPFRTVVAAVAKLRSEVGEERHRQLAKQYRQYCRRPGGKRGLVVVVPVPFR
jgi:hypothetical protein